MMKFTSKEQEKTNQKIIELEEENSHLKNKLYLLGSGVEESVFSIPNKKRDEPYSIKGLEGMYLQIDESGYIININKKMSELIGYSKEEMYKHSIYEFDNIPWAKNIFKTLITECKNTHDDIEWESVSLDVTTGKERNLLFRVSSCDCITSITIEDRTQYKEIMQTFSRYVSQKVIKKMQDSETDYFETNRMNVSIIFADLRGFTAMSSQMEPFRVKDLLNEFLTSLIDVVDKFEGTVDKIIGDEIMVLFGAPYPMMDHAFRGVKASIEMQKAHQKLLEKWRKENRPVPPLGIGLNSGDVVVGNIGSKSRMDYTAIGHHVNLASRLCGAANGGEILVTENTVLELSKFVEKHQEVLDVEIHFQKAGKMLFKGLDQKITVARVLYDIQGTNYV